MGHFHHSFLFSGIQIVNLDLIFFLFFSFHILNIICEHENIDFAYHLTSHQDRARNLATWVVGWFIKQ